MVGTETGILQEDMLQTHISIITASSRRNWIGDVVLYARTSVGTVKPEPGERKEVVAKNAESDTPFLSGGDLYPAGIIE